ncbi:AP-3 complex subunit delta-like [Silene latifolia]|uniref:AP-3 complex subunit delta-like n=1 Tax=Silene latifolia TaxID=37657 RepID=UPI003D7704B7
MSNSSIMETLFQRSLDDLIKGIRLFSPDSSTQFSSTFISNAIDEIRREIKSTDPSTKSTALLKLTYLNSIYGVDMNWAAFNIVEVISFPQFYLKKIGYLAATTSFNEDTDVIILATNHFRKDLSSPNDFEVSLGLHCLSVIGTTDLCRDLCNDVYVLLCSTRSYVRKKAIAVVLRVFRKYPDAVRVCFKRLVENLESFDQQNMCAVVGVFCELASREPEAYLPLAPEFFKVLIECKNNWVLIKVLKIFAKLAPLEPRLAKKIVEPICEIMERSIAKSLVFECIRTVVNSLSDYESAVKLAVLKIKEFLNEDDPNLKYLGLQALSDLSLTHSWAVLENKEAVFKSLKDVDPNIKLASLKLIMAMVSEDNVAEITKVLVNYALKSDLEFCNEILRSILTTCSNNYYEIVFDFDWYVLLLGDLSRIPHCQTGEEIENQLVDIGMRVKDARPELVSVGRNIIIDPALLGNPHVHRILSAAAWISGEYIEFSKNPLELMEALLQPRTNLLPPSIRAVYIHSAFKVLVFCLQTYLGQQDEDENASSQELVSKMLNLAESALEPLLWDNDVEVQERARNILGIVQLVKEGPLVSVQDEDNSKKKEPECSEIIKLIYEMFADEIGPVSINAQAKIPVPDGVVLKDDLTDLDTIYSDVLLDSKTCKPIESSLLSVGENNEDTELSSKSESLLSQHRKRHGLYYLSLEKDDSTSTDYPPVNDVKDTENEVDDLVKLTERTLNSKKKRNHAKPRPVVVKLDEGENFIPIKKLESTDDLLSGAVREFLISNEEVSTSRKGKEKVTDSLVNQKQNLEDVEIRNTSTKRSNHKTRGRERKQHTNGENDDGKEERRRKGKKNSTRHNRPKEQKTGDSDIAVNPSQIPDFLL